MLISNGVSSCRSVYDELNELHVHILARVPLAGPTPGGGAILAVPGPPMPMVPLPAPMPMPMPIPNSFAGL